MSKIFLSIFYFFGFYLAVPAQELLIRHPGADSQVLFGVKKIREAATRKKWSLVPNQHTQNGRQQRITISIISDSVLANDLGEKYRWKKPAGWGDQCYAIRKSGGADSTHIFVLAGETTGAMYGAFDIAEFIQFRSVKDISDADHAPYLARRGIKYNLPLDLRTPSYSDPGDAHQQNIPDSWDLEFWRSYFDEMASHRYNVMTWWSLQPFPSMVKIPEFPETALDDVWRTKEKYDDSYSSLGTDFDRPYLFSNVEVVKKISMDEKIVFWKKVMQLAADRGIDIYLFTWNKFTYGVTGKYGITNRQDNDTTIAWYRAAVREMIRTYPLLRGIGITAGEGMENNRKDEYSNEKWLWKTYGEGIRDGLKTDPHRKFTLVHRFHWASLNEIQTEFRELPCTLELSLKYAIAHMYSITDPPFILPAIPLLSPQLQSWLTLRNDDVYSFRWANNDYARAFIKSIPSVEKIAGFYMGPDGYCWGRDYLAVRNEKSPPELIIQKQWYSFMLWGRLGYDPTLPDDVFYQQLPQHFPRINTDELIKGWSAASLIFPWITRFVWGDIDLKWFPEANLSHSSHKGFYTVKDYAEREPMQGSHIENILNWAARQATRPGSKDSLYSPLDVADTLNRLSDISYAALQKLPKAGLDQTDERNKTLTDILAFATVGKYYAQKIRAACNLALLDATRDEKYRKLSLQQLGQAQHYWNQYAQLYSRKNKPALYNRVGYVDVNKLKEKVQADIDIVRNWKPGENQLNKTGRTEVPFRQ